MSTRREIYPDELSFFYQKTGEAIWHLQYVEDFLAKLYIIKAVAKKPDGILEDEAEKVLRKLQKNTLGQLIHKIEAESVVSKKFLEKLKDFNNERKWIVHNSNRERESLYTDSGRKYFLERIEKFTDKATELQQMVVIEIVDYGNDLGISGTEILRMAEKKINELKGEV